MAAWPIAWARWLLPVPGEPRNKASSCLAMKLAVARSKTRLRFIFLLKLKSKLSSVTCGSRNSAAFLRRSSRRSLRRDSSSETKQEIRSMGAIGSAWAWWRRVSSTVAMPPRRSCFKARFSSIRFMVLLLDFHVDQIAVLDQFTDQRIDLTQGQLWAALQKAPNEAVFVDAQLECSGAGIFNSVDAELLR